MTLLVIDLGTTNVRCALLGTDGRPVVIPFSDTATVSPTFVAFRAGKAISGAEASDLVFSDVTGDGVDFATLREMAPREFIRADAGTGVIAIVRNRPSEKHPGLYREHTPASLISLLVKKCVKNARERLHIVVDRVAVVWRSSAPMCEMSLISMACYKAGVPLAGVLGSAECSAYAALGGLSHAQFPTAAQLSRNASGSPAGQGPRLAMVLDVGSGHASVAFVTLDAEPRVVVARGTSEFGSEDVNAALAAIVTGNPRPDLSRDPALRLACESAKISLSMTSTATITHNGTTHKLTREAFDAACFERAAPLVGMLREAYAEAVSLVGTESTAAASVVRLSDILLCGGGCGLPCLVRLIDASLPEGARCARRSVIHRGGDDLAVRGGSLLSGHLDTATHGNGGNLDHSSSSVAGVDDSFGSFGSPGGKRVRRTPQPQWCLGAAFRRPRTLFVATSRGCEVLLRAGDDPKWILRGNGRGSNGDDVTMGGNDGDDVCDGDNCAGHLSLTTSADYQGQVLLRFYECDDSAPDSNGGGGTSTSAGAAGGIGSNKYRHMGGCGADLVAEVLVSDLPPLGKGVPRIRVGVWDGGADGPLIRIENSHGGAVREVRPSGAVLRGSRVDPSLLPAVYHHLDAATDPLIPSLHSLLMRAQDSSTLPKLQFAQRPDGAGFYKYEDPYSVIDTATQLVREWETEAIAGVQRWREAGTDIAPLAAACAPLTTSFVDWVLVKVVDMLPGDEGMREERKALRVRAERIESIWSK